MKKTIQKIMILAICVGTGLTISCKKDSVANPVNCSSNADKVTDAAIAYGNNPTKANCEAYKKTISDLYKSCATFYTGAYKQALDEFLAEPCPD
jgi:hypothetical protein